MKEAGPIPAFVVYFMKICWKRTITVLCLTVLAAASAVACGLPAPAPITRAPIEGPDDLETLERAPNSATLHRRKGEPVIYGGTKWYPREGAVNILLIGVDKDASRHETGRSDMLILCTVDTNEGDISFLTIPRDTHAYIYQIAEDGQIQGEVHEKINHAYAYGGGADAYSAENTMAAVSRLLSCGGLLDVPIHYYMSIDLDGLAELADVFGGVEVVFDQTIPGVGQAGETVNLQGPFVRYYLERRHDMSEGEVSRQKHQQTFLKALLQKIKERGAAQSAPELFSIFLEFMRTNLSLRQCLSIAALVDKLNVEDVRFMRISGTGVTEDGVWYLEPNEEEMVQLVLASQYTPAS